MSLGQDIAAYLPEAARCFILDLSWSTAKSMFWKRTMDVLENWPGLLHLFPSSEQKQIKQQKLMGIKGLDMENSVYSREKLGK